MNPFFFHNRFDPKNVSLSFFFLFFVLFYWLFSTMNKKYVIIPQHYILLLLVNTTEGILEISCAYINSFHIILFLTKNIKYKNPHHYLLLLPANIKEFVKFLVRA